jgi:hypothetical protein
MYCIPYPLSLPADSEACAFGSVLGINVIGSCKVRSNCKFSLMEACAETVRDQLKSTTSQYTSHLIWITAKGCASRLRLKAAPQGCASRLRLKAAPQGCAPLVP